jgi:hypothetical protein
VLRNKVIKYESSPSLGELSLTQRHKRERRARARGGIKSPVGFISGTNPVINLHTNSATFGSKLPVRLCAQATFCFASFMTGTHSTHRTCRGGVVFSPYADL